MHLLKKLHDLRHELVTSDLQGICLQERALFPCGLKAYNASEILHFKRVNVLRTGSSKKVEVVVFMCRRVRNRRAPFFSPRDSHSDLPTCPRLRDNRTTHV